jgi:hypothetical protein
MRDFTDYEAIVLGYQLSKKNGNETQRTFHKIHFSSKVAKDPANWKTEHFFMVDGQKVFRHNGHTFAFNINKAVWLKGWVPWDQWLKDHPIKSIREFLRSKRIGLLLYEEPGDGR